MGQDNSRYGAAGRLPTIPHHGDDQLRDAGSSRAQFGLALAVLRSGETALLAYAGNRRRRAWIAPAIFSRALRRAVSVPALTRPTLESGRWVSFGLFGRRRRLFFWWSHFLFGFLAGGNSSP